MRKVVVNRAHFVIRDRRYEIEEGEKVAEIEVTMPSGEIKVQEIFNDTAIGYNKLGEEVVRITIEEPTFERPADLHVNSI